MMTLRSDRSAAMHCWVARAGEHECAGLGIDVQDSARLGWGRVHRGEDATLSIFGLPMGYSLIGSVRYI